MHGLAAGQRDGGGPEGIVGSGDEHLVAVVEQSLHGERDELAHAVARVDVVHVDVGNALLLAVLDDGLAGADDAVRVGVALGGGKAVGHVLHKVVGSLEAEVGGIADVELQDVLAAAYHAVGLVHDGAADVVADVIQLV